MPGIDISCGCSHTEKEMWLAREKSGFPWSPIIAVNLQAQLLLLCLAILCRPALLSVHVMVPLGLVHPSGCWSGFLCGFNPRFYLPSCILVPACRCLGLWWQCWRLTEQGSQALLFSFCRLTSRLHHLPSPFEKE